MFTDFPPTRPRRPAAVLRLVITLEHFEPGPFDVAPGDPHTPAAPSQRIAYRAVFADDRGLPLPAADAAGDLSPHLTPAERAQLLTVLDTVLARAQKLIQSETETK